MKTPKLPMQAVLERYEALRTEYRGRSPSPIQRAGAIEDALFAMFHQYTGPFRVVRFSELRGEVHPHYVVFLVHGHGLEEDVWVFRGDHQERDAVRMSVMLRNLLAWGQEEALEEGDVHWSLRFCREHVAALAQGREEL